jgi:hypothetical protein
MKTISMIKGNLFSKVYFLSAGVILALTSCLNDDSAEKQAAHDQALALMIQEYDISAGDTIADGVYMHITGISNEDTLKAKPGDYIILDLAGYNSEGNLINVTDSATAAENEVYRNDLVYGPVIVNINNTFPGFYTAIQHLPQGSAANMVFSADQAFGGYEPYAYEVELYRVIDDYAEYLDTCYTNYRDTLRLTEADLYDDAGFSKVYYRVEEPGTHYKEIEIGDSVTIELHGYYAEADPLYRVDSLGREFFPFVDTIYTVTFIKGTTYFPITEVVSEMVSDSMYINEVRTILTPDDYAYGSSGFVHPYTGTFLVPPGMPLHYYIKLIDVAEYGYK